MNLFPIWCLDTMQAIKLREQGVGVVFDVVVVVLEYVSQKLVLGMVDGFDDILVVPRKVKETTALAGRT